MILERCEICDVYRDETSEYVIIHSYLNRKSKLTKTLFIHSFHNILRSAWKM